MPRAWGVEGELGCLGSLESGEGEAEDGHGAEGVLSHDQLLTDPVQAQDPRGEDRHRRIGRRHRQPATAYKFTRPPKGDVLAMDRIIAIHKLLPNCHLVMHGSSSVPQDLQDELNKYGGKMKPTWGVPVEEIQLGIKNGVRKINVDTDNRMAITAAVRKALMESPRKSLTPATT